MNSSNEKSEKKEKIEMKENEEISDGSEENSGNADQEEDPALNVNYAQFITTPYERVLAIINEAKTFILSITKEQQELIKGLEWAIKVISSHNLYSYEIKEQDYLNQVSEENQDFKQFIEFVNSYNEEVIQMNEKSNNIRGNSHLNSKRLNVPSNFNAHREDKNIKEKIKKENVEKKSSINNEINNKENNKAKNINNNISSTKSKNIFTFRNKNKSLNKGEIENFSKSNNYKPNKLIRVLIIKRQ